MAEELWNKINIPFPSAVSVYRVPFSEAAEAASQCVVAKCEKFLKLFCSEVLQTEIRVLYDVMYVIYNSFRRHKPFRALKQVEQCVNRVKEMKLQEVVQDLWETCPKKAQRTVGLECGECDVPSQAFLEWVCVKMVGGARLLTRLLDHCSRTFILTRQHLQTGDFLILNLLLISMLSRLWVLFRGLLRALGPLYQHSLELLELVAQARPLPYLTGFTLPGDLCAVLGPSGARLMEMELTGRTRRLSRRASKAPLLSRLFEEGGEGSEGERKRKRKGMTMGVQKARRLEEDLGSLVLQRHRDVMSVGAQQDIKALLMGNRTANTQIAKLPNQRCPSSQDQAVIGQERTFVKWLDSASSFSDLAVTLQEVTQWCRDRKLTQESRCLAFMCLRTRRMATMEADGLSVKGRLQRFQRTLRQILLLGRWCSPRSSHSLRTLWRQRLGSRGSFRTAPRTLWRHSGSHRARTSKAACRTVRTSKHKELQRQPVDPASVPLPHGTSEDEGSGNDIISPAAGNRKSTKVIQQKTTNADDDIDDIFASIGF